MTEKIMFTAYAVAYAAALRVTMWYTDDKRKDIE